MEKLKIAYCIAGELRTFNDENIINSLNEYIIKPLNPDIFISTWDHIGVSVHQENNFDKLSTNVNIDDIYKSIPNIKGINIENLDNWLSTIPVNLKDIFINWRDNGNFSGYNGGYASSVPFFYKTWDSFRLKKDYELKNNFEYDVVLKGRPDLGFVNHINLDVLKDNTVIHNNFGPPGWYHPNRIYDIFFYSQNKTMNILSDSWLDYQSLIDDGFDNGNGKLDATRILYLQSLRNNINVESYNKRFCEVYRSVDFNQFIYNTKQYDQ